MKFLRAAWSDVGRAVVGVVVLGGWGGCMADPGAVAPPRMPTVRPAAPAEPVKVVTAAEALGQAREAASRDDTEAMVGAVDALPAEERSGVVREVFAELARQDASRAARMMAAMPARVMPDEAIEDVARAMVARDAEAAVQWALAPSTPAREFVVRRAVAEQVMAREPRAALERLTALPSSAGRHEMVNHAAAAWVRRDATAALAWGRALPEGEERTRVVTSMGFALARTTPGRAVEVAEWLPAGRDRMLLVAAIGQTWVARNADEAWKWARELPAGDAREAALSGIETGLGGARSRGLAGRAQGGRGFPSVTGRVGGGGVGGALVRDASAMPLGLERDDALRREFEEALLASPQQAAGWLATQPLPDRRDEMKEALARRWLAINPEAARQWMEQNIFLPERREQLLREAGR